MITERHVTPPKLVSSRRPIQTS